MAVSVTFTGETLEDVLGQIAAAAGAESTPAPKKTTPKAEPKKAEPKKEEPKAEEPKEEPASEDKVDVAALRDEAGKLAREYASKNGREAFTGLLDEFGSKNISGVSDDNIEDLVARLRDGV